MFERHDDEPPHTKRIETSSVGQICRRRIVGRVSMGVHDPNDGQPAVVGSAFNAHDLSGIEFVDPTRNGRCSSSERTAQHDHRRTGQRKDRKPRLATPRSHSRASAHEPRQGSPARAPRVARPALRTISVAGMAKSNKPRDLPAEATAVATNRVARRDFTHPRLPRSRD